MTTSIYPPQVRGDNTLLPTIASDFAFTAGYVKIADWQYFQMSIDTPFTFIPFNRTLKNVPVILRNCALPDLSLDTGITESFGGLIARDSGEGYDGAIMDDSLDQANCSVQAKVTSIQKTTGISLQDESGTISHTYTDITVAHALLLGQNGQGTIYELGNVVSNNAYFKYAVDDIALIEVINGICRYMLVHSDGSIELLRTTASKLTEDAKAEFLLYFTDSALLNVFVFDGDQETTNYESIGVCYFRNDWKNLYWQQFGNQRSRASIGDTIEMADKRVEVTYSNQKKRLTALALTPKAYSLDDYWKFQEFADYHDIGKEFIFIDYGRKDLNYEPTEFFAKFSAALVDATRNACQFDLSIGILEDFRNDFIPKLIDEIAPEVEITEIVSGSAVISGTASDNNYLVSLALYKNSKFYSDIPLPASGTDWSITVPTGDLGEGINSFYVIAMDYAGNSTQSDTATYTLDTIAPTAPTGFSATKFSSSRIDLAWSAATDNVAVTGYQLRRATNSGFTTGVTDIDLGNVLSYHNTGLSSSTQYWYKVRARDAEGNYSPYSTADDDTTDAPPPIVVEYDLDLQSYSNNASVNNLVDSSGNGYHATGSSQLPLFKTDDGNYLLFSDGGGNINYLTIPNYTSLIGSQAQIYFVLKLGGTTTKIGRFLGDPYSEMAFGGLYEPFGTTVRKDNKISSPLLSAGWCVYRVVSRNGFYEMSVNGTVFFTTATNTFDKSHPNPFILGYTANGCTMKVKYIAILNDNTTNLVSSLRTRFSI